MSRKSLSAWQDTFAKALLNPEKDYGMLADMTNNYIRQQRLNVYRNNVFYSLVDAIKSLYPVVEQLIGDDAFSFLARQYVASHLPQRGTLIGYGHLFADFLQSATEKHSALKAAPYLADIAQLEYALHQAFHALDACIVEPTQLASIDAEQLALAQLILHPSVILLQSAWPVSAIWKAHLRTPVNLENIDLYVGTDYILVIRIEHQLEVRTLSAADWHFLYRIQQQDTLAMATENTLEKHTDFSLDRLFQSMLFDGTFHNILPSTNNTDGD